MKKIYKDPEEQRAGKREKWRLNKQRLAAEHSGKVTSHIEPFLRIRWSRLAGKSQ